MQVFFFFIRKEFKYIKRTDEIQDKTSGRAKRQIFIWFHEMSCLFVHCLINCNACSHWPGLSLPAPKYILEFHRSRCSQIYGTNATNALEAFLRTMWIPGPAIPLGCPTKWLKSSDRGWGRSSALLRKCERLSFHSQHSRGRRRLACYLSTLRFQFPTRAAWPCITVPFLGRELFQPSRLTTVPESTWGGEETPSAQSCGRHSHLLTISSRALQA